MFGRKKKKMADAARAARDAVKSANSADAVSGVKPRALTQPTEEEYKNYIRVAKERIEISLEDFGRLAEELRVSAKKVSRVKGIFASKISRRKEKKYGAQLKTYNENLTAFITASSELNRLIESVGSCYEGLARLASSPRESRKIRVEAEKYSAAVMFKKAKHDKRVDGVVMPISSYVK